MATQPPFSPNPSEGAGLGTPAAPQYGPSQQEWGQPLQPSSAPGASGPRAGFWQRFGASLLDGLLLTLIEVVLVVALKTAGNILAIIVAVAYFVYFEGGPTGQTLGKRALGIRVISFDTGGQLGYVRAFVRYIGKFISTIFVFLGYLWMLWDREKQCWHDKMAADVVVPVSAYPVGPPRPPDPAYPSSPFAQ